MVLANGQTGERRTTTVGCLTSLTLVALSGLHVAWGFGSSVPFRSRAELADAVIGSRSVPSPAACGAVAAALLGAAACTADVPFAPHQIRRLGRFGVVTVLTTRGVLGLLRRTDLVSPGSCSPRFQRLDRRVYAPLCLALAAGCANAVSIGANVE